MWRSYIIKIKGVIYIAMNEYIQSAIQTIVYKAINDAPFDKTRTGIVKAVNTNNTYKVLIDGVEYPNVPIWQGLMAKTNDVVRVKFPSGNVSQMYICEASVESQSLIGEIKEYAGQVIPNGWLECNGAEVSKADYPKLYEAIGNLWGTPSSSSNFLLPNFNGKVLVGYDATDADFDTVGKGGGEKTHTLTVNEMPPHAHIQRGSTSGAISGSGRTRAGYTTQYSGSTTDDTGGGESHNNLQPYVVIKYIICAQ